MSSTETLELVSLSQADDAAIEMFVRAYQQTVYRLALSILDDPAEAEEAAQDSLVAAINALETYRGDSAFTTWLHAITLNICRTRLRKRRSRERLLETLRSILRLGSETVPPPEEVAIRNEADAAVSQAVEQLDEKYRLPVILRYYNDFSVAEIARLLNISEGTAHSRLFTAREHLRAELGGEYSVSSNGKRDRK